MKHIKNYNEDVDQEYPKDIVGKRIFLIKMYDDPNPVPKGTEGTITHFGGGVINVDWDNGRSLGIIDGYDQYILID